MDIKKKKKTIINFQNNRDKLNKRKKKPRPPITIIAQKNPKNHELQPTEKKNHPNHHHHTTHKGHKLAPLPTSDDSQPQQQPKGKSQSQIPATTLFEKNSDGQSQRHIPPIPAMDETHQQRDNRHQLNNFLPQAKGGSGLGSARVEEERKKNQRGEVRL